MDKSIFDEFGREILSQLPGFNLINFYAVAVLESAGFPNSNQDAIDTVERILKDNSIDIGFDSPINYLIDNTKSYRGKVLLLENNLMLLKAHFILLSNKGYHVDAVQTLKEFEVMSKYHYAEYSVIGFNHQFYKRTSLKFIEAIQD